MNPEGNQFTADTKSWLKIQSDASSLCGLKNYLLLQDQVTEEKAHPMVIYLYKGPLHYAMTAI
jgi:hypothetical protein